MGNAAATLRQAGQQSVKRKLPPAPSLDEQAVISRIVAQEQQRMRDLPSLEALGTKDEPLDQLLSKISSAITPRQVDVTGHGTAQEGQQGGGVPASSPPEPSAGGRGTAVMMSAKARLPIPEWKPSGLTPEQLTQFKDRSGGAQRGRTGGVRLADDDDPGRVQAWVIRDVLEAKNAAESSGQELDVSAFVRAHGGDPAQLEQLMQYCAIPSVGRIKTFGHEYAYARPPLWWLPKTPSSGAVYKSEAAVLEAASSTGTALPAGFVPPQLRGGGHSQKQTQQLGDDSGQKAVTG